jgi:hypothetical protein
MRTVASEAAGEDEIALGEGRDGAALALDEGWGGGASGVGAASGAVGAAAALGAAASWSGFGAARRGPLDEKRRRTARIVAVMARSLPNEGLRPPLAARSVTSSLLR